MLDLFSWQSGHWGPQAQESSVLGRGSDVGGEHASGSASNPGSHHPSLTNISTECKRWHSGSQDDKGFFTGMNRKGVDYVSDDNTADNE